MKERTDEGLDLKVNEAGAFTYQKGRVQHCANFPLFLVKAAWTKGCGMEDLADGFGKGMGTMGGDWSGIRDSSEEATNLMLERALVFLGLLSKNFHQERGDE